MLLRPYILCGGASNYSDGFSFIDLKLGTPRLAAIWSHRCEGLNGVGCIDLG